VMLQQTQVATVVPYYERFLARFPDVTALALASEEAVLALWSGLGYYARARNLHAAARRVLSEEGGHFPSQFDRLLRLPGVGRSTAAAIAVFAGGERRAILDGNAKRVIARHAGIAGNPASAAVLARLWRESEARLPRRSIEAYTQGLMDLGASLCLARNPRCDACPVATDCVARATGRVDELPGRKRSLRRTHRRASLLAVVLRGEVLLEKRPSPGVWGGLWSLPEMPVGARPAEFLRRRFGIPVARVQRLERFEHAFTHFTLEITPWKVQAKAPASRSSALEERGCLWLALDDVGQAALPAPIRRLLGRLA
jgi:A/G-specific adenine glycosylase